MKNKRNGIMINLNFNNTEILNLTNSLNNTKFEILDIDLI